MEKLLSILLAANSHAKTLHWTSKSFATHIALQELYEALESFTDRLAEEWMGKYGNDVIIDSTVNAFNQQNAIDFVKSLFSYLESAKTILPSDDWLVNTYEELQSKVSQVKYKLENLS